MLPRPSQEDYLQWDIYVWGKALKFWEDILNSKNLQEGTLLELGSRDGGLSLYFAANFNFKVLCADLNGPTETAKELHHKFKVSSKISYESADALCLNYPDNVFDVVVFKSILGSIGKNESIHNQQKAIEEIRRVLKPNGILLFAENGKATALHSAARKIFNKWASYWRYITLDEMSSFLKKFRYSELRTTGFISVFFPGRKIKKTAYALDNVLEKIIPRKFRYVIYGYAIK